MEKNKKNLLIAVSVLTLILLIVFIGLNDRFSYEKATKSVYLSANYDDLKKNNTDIPKTLKKMKKSNVNFVTVSPVTFFQMQAMKEFDVINYSSLKINEDEISKQISESLKNENAADNDIILISSDKKVTKFLHNNLPCRYDTEEKNIDEVTDIFLIRNKMKNDDFIIGYKEDDISEIKKCGLEVAISYPAYTFENREYADYFQKFLIENEVKFLILRNNERENKIPLSEEFKDRLKRTDTALVIFENENQVKNEEPFIFDDMSEIFYEKTIRGFNMDKVVTHDNSKYKYRYYQWYNSAIERNTTFLNINILKNENETSESNINLTLEAVDAFTEKMKSQGYNFPDSREAVAYRYNLQTGALCGGIAIFLILFIYLSLLEIKNKNLVLITTFLCFLSAIVSYMFYDYVTKYYAVLLMILIISALTLALFKASGYNTSVKNKVIFSLSAFLYAVISGSILITAMFSDVNFYLGNKWVVGVKMSLLLPFLTTAYNYKHVYFKEDSPKELLEKTKEKLKKIPLYILIIAGILFLGVLTYYLIRTGKSDLILPIEDNLRKKLTDIFTIRPRTKEFLIGYPCFFIFLYVSIFRKNDTVKMVSGIFMTLLFTSVLNTFCHAFTDFSVSIRRTLNGLLSGLIISALIILICELTYLIITKKDTIRNKFKEFFLKLKELPTQMKKDTSDSATAPAPIPQPKTEVEKTEKTEKIEKTEKSEQKPVKKQKSMQNKPQKKKKKNARKRKR